MSHGGHFGRQMRGMYKQDDDHSIGEEMIQGGGQEYSKPSDPLNIVEKQRAHHVEKEVKDQMRRYESPRRNY